MMAEKKKIRVLMTSPSSDMGGAEKSLWFLSSKLKEKEQFEIYGAFPRGSLYNRLKINFKHIQPLILIEFIPNTKNLLYLPRMALYFVTLAINLLLCIKEILINSIDLVYANSSINLSAIYAAVLTRRRLVVYLREDYFRNDQSKRLKLFKSLVKYSQLMLCQSRSLAEEIGKMGGKVEMLYDGAYQIDETTRTTTKYDDKSFNLGIVGKIYPLKGQLTFVKAIHQLKEEGLPVKGYVFGSARRFSSHWQYYKQIKKIQKDIILVGEPLGLEEIYRNLDAVVIASQNEGFSMVYPEALKFGKPVISTRTGIMAEVGRDGDNLMFFDQGNDRQLAEKIKALYNDKSQLSRLVKGGQETSRKYFNEEAIARQFISILNEVANARRD